MRMWLLIFFATLIWFIYTVSKTAKDTAQTGPNSSYDPCNPPPGKAAKHKWLLKFPDGSSDHLGYLICKSCGKMPGNLD